MSNKLTEGLNQAIQYIIDSKMSDEDKFHTINVLYWIAGLGG